MRGFLVGMPSDDLLRNYLIRNGFAPAAVPQLLRPIAKHQKWQSGRDAHMIRRVKQTREHDDMATSQHRQGVAQQRESYETTFTPSSGMPFQIIYNPGGKRSEEHTSELQSRPHL